MSVEKDDAGFLSRWSKRKISGAEEESKPDSALAQAPNLETPEQEQQSDAESVEKNEQVEQPLWQQQDADPLVKKQALKDLFKQSEFGTLDGLNEYDEDYTSFPSLGNVVTREMKRMLKLAEEKTRPEADVHEQQIEHTSADTVETNDDVADSESNEDEGSERV